MPGADAPPDGGRPDDVRSTVPARAPLVLVSLILVATVANLNLAVANVALPSIGKAFDSSQTSLNLVAVGYSLGLAASVLYLGAVGDRYGRKLLLVAGLLLSVPACLLAAFAWDDDVLIVARDPGRGVRGHGLPDDARAHHRAVDRCRPHQGDRPVVRARRRDDLARPARRRRAARALLVGFGLPHHASPRGDRSRDGLAVRPRARQRVVAAGRPPRRGAVDRPRGHAGAVDQLRADVRRATTVTRPGVHRASPRRSRSCWRQRRAANPLYDLDIARRRTFWVAACAGIIVFGSLMGASFVSQQYLQNVLDYDTIEAGAAFLPAVVVMVLVAPRSAKLVGRYGARVTLLHRATCRCSSRSS